jgi:hypothetical protein
MYSNQIAFRRKPQDRLLLEKVDEISSSQNLSVALPRFHGASSPQRYKEGKDTHASCDNPEACPDEEFEV